VIHSLISFISGNLAHIKKKLHKLHKNKPNKFTNTNRSDAAVKLK